MSDQEARDEIAQIVKAISTKWSGPALREFENDPPIRKHFAIADALIAAGYGKQPDPEVTDEMVERAWEGWSSTVGTRRMRAALEAALGVTA